MRALADASDAARWNRIGVGFAVAFIASIGAALGGCSLAGDNGSSGASGAAASSGTSGSNAASTGSGSTGNGGASSGAGGIVAVSGASGAFGATGSTGSSALTSGSSGSESAAGTGSSDDLDAGISTPAPDASVTSGSSGSSAGTADAALPKCGGSVLGTGPTTTTTTHLDIGVHDPSMIWDGSKYYLFATGGTLAVRSSPDIRNWSNVGNVLPAIPGWMSKDLGTTPGDLWAPDVSYFGGQFHVYYAGSSFGSNNSAIGLATTPSLASPQWSDQGLVFQSHTTDNFNAIDPNLSFDQNCTPWLSFGSFWSGIKMRKLDAGTGKLATDDTTLYSIAGRNGGAIEAPSIITHNGYYYLFVAFDACCKGVNSTYRTMVGRASKITGPYANKTGEDMMTGAAEQLLATSGRYIGPGGGTAWLDGTTYLYAYHYYDGDDGGASKLQVRPITFDSNDWIVLGDPLFP